MLWSKYTKSILSSLLSKLISILLKLSSLKYPSYLQLNRLLLKKSWTKSPNLRGISKILKMKYKSLRIKLLIVKQDLSKLSHSFPVSVVKRLHGKPNLKDSLLSMSTSLVTYLFLLVSLLILVLLLLNIVKIFVLLGLNSVRKKRFQILAHLVLLKYSEIQSKSVNGVFTHCPMMTSL
jgi:hypothetical protein